MDGALLFYPNTVLSLHYNSQRDDFHRMAFLNFYNVDRDEIRFSLCTNPEVMLVYIYLVDIGNLGLKLTVMSKIWKSRTRFRPFSPMKSWITSEWALWTS
jgi:hypothetical protein